MHPRLVLVLLLAGRSASVEVVGGRSVAELEVGEGREEEANVEEDMKEEQPNILLLLVDDLGHGDLGYTGHPTSSSPNIDSLARRSVELTQFYTASSICSPSRGALLTGLHPASLGLYPGVLFADSLGGLDPAHTTLPEALAGLGYRTAMAGKWHLGVGENGTYLPTRQGFSSYLGMPYSHDMCPFHGCYPGQDGCDLPSPHPSMPPCPLYRDETIVEQPTDMTTLTARYTEFAEEFMLQENTQPFFLYFSFNHVHFPQFSSTFYRNSSLRGAFGDSVAEVDGAVGRLMEVLELAGLLENTLVVLTSDNGARVLAQGAGQGGSSGLFRCGKGTTYEGGHRVPALLHWPGRLLPRREAGLVSMLDLAPTLVALAGGSLSSAGLNLAPALLAGTPSPREEVAFIHPWATDGRLHALRLGAYKAHWQTEGSLMSLGADVACIDVKRQHDPPLLYNVEHDPQELYRLNSDTEELWEEVVEAMERRRGELEGGAIPWATSVTGGRGDEAMPCCSPGCQPFPSCCSCEQLRD